MRNNELMHYGVLGQKWGIRRYQNEDGSLTSAGKRRYSLADERLSNREKYITKKYDTDRMAAKLGTFTNIRSAAVRDSEAKKVRDMNKAIRADDDRMLKLGRKTHNQRVTNVATAGIASGASAAALLSIGASLPIAAIPVAAITAGSIYVDKLIRR